MVDWSLLPEDLLFVIAKCLKNHFDVLHFRSVCTTWRASVPSNLRPRPSFSSSFLLGVDKAGKEYFVSYCTVCLFKFPADSSHSIPRFCLVKLKEDDFGKIRLVHPILLREKLMVEYPLVLDISNLHVQEVIRLYASPGNHNNLGDIVAMKVDPCNDDGDDCPLIILGADEEVGYLRFVKAGDEEATSIEVGGDFRGLNWARQDCIQFERKFYVVDILGTTVCIDPCSRTSFVVEKTFTVHEDCDLYLVELCGNLLLVEALYESTPTSLGFKVFQLDRERKRWDRLQSLGDGILFLGVNCKFSASAIPAVKGNCIVFAHERVQERPIQIVEEAFVFHMSSRITVPLEQRPDLLQLFRPPFHTG